MSIQPYAYHPPVMLTDKREPNAAHVTIAWVVAVATFFYMLPWAIAASRGKANVGAIALIDALLGWTFIGWVIALVMACMPHKVLAVR